MLARWFDRNGIGQYLAPDEKATKDVEDNATGTFWQIVAPDPNFQAAAPPGPPTIASGQVLCEHCHRWTSTGTPRASTPPSQTQKSDPQQLFTPTPTKPSRNFSSSSSLEGLVMSAAKSTAISMSSPQEARNKVFRFCGSSKALNDKMLKRLRNLLQKDPSLAHARATHLGLMAPDGYTPLMACAHSDHVVAAKLVLEVSNTAHLDRDLQGRTALHIAAEMGHMDMIKLLQPLYTIQGIKSPPPLDLLGRTPLGRAITSPNPKARKRQKELETALFSPGDLSVFGDPKPEHERAVTDEKLKLAYGIADMPGWRGFMEDAVSSSKWQKNGKSFCLIGVCDGHGDRGKVSGFIADNVSSVLQTHMEEEDAANWGDIWKKTCLELDDKLKQKDIPGGSTAVLALITEELIIVANVGDSRAVLVQSRPATTGLEEKMEKMEVSVKDGEGKAAPDNKAQEEKQQGPMAVALSDDHKPNLPEEQSRIENAGMKVVPISFIEVDGKEMTIHKVHKTDSEQLAVSRAFGDFEYKHNTTLGSEEQAITAVPDVRVHNRDHDTDMYLILACDGIWDVMDNQTAVDFVSNQVQIRSNTTDSVLPEIGDTLLRESFNRGSRDNMTTVLVALSKESEQFRPSVIEGKALDFGS